MTHFVALANATRLQKSQNAGRGRSGEAFVAAQQKSDGISAVASFVLFRPR
jgi:hypothetical protein